jgi:hypothetical protein
MSTEFKQLTFVFLLMFLGIGLVSFGLGWSFGVAGSCCGAGIQLSLTGMWVAHNCGIFK